MACSLRIPRLPGVRQLDLQALRSRLLAEGEHGSLQSQSWEEFRVDDVEVKFSIGYAYTTVYLLFEVHEPEIRATYRNHLDPVYRDSCVEFFIADAQGRYLNVECNPFGAVLSGIGIGRTSRTLMEPEFFGKLQVDTSLYEGNESGWEALLRIPLDGAGLVKSSDDLSSLPFTGNLYKCGDDLQRPHYLSWSPIGTKQPDFHQSAYFGSFAFS